MLSNAAFFIVSNSGVVISQGMAREKFREFYFKAGKLTFEKKVRENLNYITADLLSLNAESLFLVTCDHKNC